MYLFKGPAPVKEFAAQMRPPLNIGVRLGGRAFLHDYEYTDGYLLEDAQRVLATISTPMILLGGVTDKQTMDRAMAAGFSYVAMGRALLADPDLPNRLRTDASAKSRCIHCNQCMPTIYTGTRCVLSSV
jgi:2,4-dienoyl-CoA reductase-like NADH-dependent reductase (Old Yellow Enzyme family)